MEHESIVFVNYRRTDSGWAADRVAEKLKVSFGPTRVFVDIRGIEAGSDFTTVIEENLRRASAIIVLIAHDWLRVQDRFGRRRLDDREDWVRKEIRTALSKPDCLVIPVLH